MTFLGQYYTADRFSDHLVACLCTRSPSQVLDLGAGHGSLSLAALRRWGNMHLATVELDATSVRKLKEVLPQGRHHRANALASRLPGAVEELQNSFDVALSNPPFMETTAQSTRPLLLSAGMPTDWPELVARRTEIGFLAQALRLLRPGGELGLIVPSTFMTGQPFMPLREWLVASVTVDRVVAFPARAFGRTDARAFAVVLRKSMPRQDHRIDLSEIGPDGELLAEARVCANDAIVRMDAAFHADSSRVSFEDIVLRDIGAEVCRGIPIGLLEQSGSAHFHTTDFEGRTSVSFSDASQPVAGWPTAQAGDVLLGRVGRNCHAQVSKVLRDSTLFSDCVYRVRVPREWRAVVAQGLLHPQATQWRRSRVVGVAARFLTKQDMLSHPVRVRSRGALPWPT